MRDTTSLRCALPIAFHTSLSLRSLNGSMLKRNVPGGSGGGLEGGWRGGGGGTAGRGEGGRKGERSGDEKGGGGEMEGDGKRGRGGDGGRGGTEGGMEGGKRGKQGGMDGEGQEPSESLPPSHTSSSLGHRHLLCRLSQHHRVAPSITPLLPFFPSTSLCPAVPPLPSLINPQATRIYYFNSHNITESSLQFRITVAEPDYDQNDNKGVARIYGLVDDGPLTQPLGSVRTDIPNLRLAFPNHFHHRVAPFEVQDKTRASHRKILVFFLVDPRVVIVSIARVPPQQLSWQRRELERKGHPCSVLPGLAIDLIAKGVGGGEGGGDDGEEGKGEISGVERGGEEGRVDEGGDGGERQGVGGESRSVDRESMGGRGATMTMEKAKKYWETLMEERRALVQLANEEHFERPFSLCEH
ncbi:unnamed protein product [Closterium sp. Naga37s-1]|nr:unnamed protein product [Closterium sp. Naga37s-1]